jgi:hypothetical protein
MVTDQRAVTPVTTFGTSLGLARGSSWQAAPVQALGAAATSSTLGQISQSSATGIVAPVSTSLGAHGAAWSPASAAVPTSVNSVNPAGSNATAPEALDGLTASRIGAHHISDAVLDDLAADSALWPAAHGYGTIGVQLLARDRVIRNPVSGDALPQGDRHQTSSDYAAGLVFLGVAAGLWAPGTGATDARKRRFGGLFGRRKSASGGMSAGS